MKKGVFLFSFFVLGVLSASDVDSLLHEKEWKDKQFYLSQENARRAQQFEHNLYHPVDNPKISLNIFTIDGKEKNKWAYRFTSNKISLSTDSASTVMEKMRMRNAFERGEWRQVAEMAQKQICHAIEDIKHIHVRTFQKLGEALHQSIKEGENL
ncbi:MAG: hypothetical protein SNF33_06340 [Candidatus Algichlamydia australiensis]|nr:hypothetical protein [Chlamydiales bacterium]